MIWGVNRGVDGFFVPQLNPPFVKWQRAAQIFGQPTLPLLLDLIRCQRPAQQGHSILLKHCRDLLSIRAGGPTDRP